MLPVLPAPDCPGAGFEPGSEWDGSFVVVGVSVVVVTDVDVVVVVTGGPGLGPGTGVGPGCGCGPGSPQLPERWLFSACTSTSCPLEHGAALWGWLLPGPWRLVLGAAPFWMAIWPAFLPLPYSFV